MSGVRVFDARYNINTVIVCRIDRNHIREDVTIVLERQITSLRAVPSDFLHTVKGIALDYEPFIQASPNLAVCLILKGFIKCVTRFSHNIDN